jgi:hypothetical protein
MESLLSHTNILMPVKVWSVPIIAETELESHMRYGSVLSGKAQRISTVRQTYNISAARFHEFTFSHLERSGLIIGSLLAGLLVGAISSFIPFYILKMILDIFVWHDKPNSPYTLSLVWHHPFSGIFQLLSWAIFLFLWGAWAYESYLSFYKGKVEERVRSTRGWTVNDKFVVISQENWDKWRKSLISS